MSRLRSIVASAVLLAPIVATASPPAQAAGTVASAISLSAPASGTYGSNITLQGRLWRYGTSYGIGGALVWLQRKPHGQRTWANIKNARTASNGNYAFAVTQTGAYDYRTVYTGSVTYRVAISPTRYPVTNQRLTLESIITANADAGTVRATAYVYPLPPNGLPVYLQRWNSEAAVWHNLAIGRTSGGKVTVSVNRPGSVNAYRLVIPARSPYGPGITAAKWFAHYVWRGALVKGVTLFAGHGAVVVPTAAQNPRRDRATQDTEHQYFTRFRVDSTGCKRAQTTSSGPTGQPQVKLELMTERGYLGTTTMYSAPVQMAGDLGPNDTWVQHFVDNFANNAYTSVYVSFLLLCAN